MKLTNFSILLISTVALGMAGCGGNFQGASPSGVASSLSAGGTAGGSTPGSTPGNSPVQLAQSDVNGTMGSGEYTGLQVITLDPNSKSIVITLPMTTVSGFPTDMGVMVPGLTGATVSATTVQLTSSGSSVAVSVPVIQVQIPLSAFLKGIPGATVTQLPGGTSMAFPESQMPAFAFNFKTGNFPLTIYLSPQMVGVFVNTPFDPTIGYYIGIQNSSKTQTLGYFMSIPRSLNNNVGGYFISLTVPNDVASVLNQLL